MVLWHYLGVDVRLAHTPGDELGVLGAEVDDENVLGSSMSHADALGALQLLSFSLE